LVPARDVNIAAILCYWGERARAWMRSRMIAG
jgi:hypothetical protein